MNADHVDKHHHGWYTVNGTPYVRPSLLFARRRFGNRDGLACMEIGVQGGSNARRIRELLHPGLFVLIDLWVDVGSNGEEYVDNRAVNLPNIYEEFLSYPEVVLISGDSKLALRCLGIGFHYVYLDGSHVYEDVKSDIDLSAPLIEKGGILAGHDYSGRGDGPGRAAHEFCDASGYELKHESGDWWVVI